jgi:hypothetical protein
MSFLKSLIRRVKRTVTAVATVAIGGALSSAAGALIRPLGSKIARNLGNLAKRAITGLRSVFVRKANTLVTKNIPPPSSPFGGGGGGFA